MVENMALSKTIEIHALTKELEKSGQKIYSLCVGEPDYQPPKEVIDATVIAFYILSINIYNFFFFPLV